MSLTDLRIRRIDSRREDIRAAMGELRAKLSPQGNVVSEAGRRRTIEVFGEPLSPQQVVERICGDVQRNGIAAVLDYSARIDKATLTAETIRVPAEELAESPCRGRSAIVGGSAPRGREHPRVSSRRFCTTTCGWSGPAGISPSGIGRSDRVGICVPGGAAAYPSTVLMTAVPAQVAGVGELAVVAPPTKFGAYNADMLATCHELGVTEVYRLGGAQAVAALAYGVEGIPRVDKIVGPGNLFVALAKRHVFGEVDIDSIAGPSEVVVIVDRIDPARVHGYGPDRPGRARPGRERADRLERGAFWTRRWPNCRGGLADLDRGELARQSLEEFGAVILARDADEACALADEIAPEHLHIATENAEELADEDPARRGDVFGQLHAGGAGRLCGRPVARAAHQRHRPIRQRTVGQRFPARQQHPTLRPGTA